MNKLRAEVTTPLALAPALLAHWQALCAASQALHSPFLGPGYARAAQQAGMTVRVCVLYRGDQPCGYFPFQFASPWQRWLGAAEPVGGSMTDYVGLAAEPGVRLAPPELLQLAGLNSFDFTHLDQSQQDWGLAGEQPRTGLRIVLDPAADDPLAALLADKAKYRKDSERRARQLAQDVGPLRFVIDEQAQRLAMLDDLVRHKRAQYQRTGARDALAAPQHLALLQALADNGGEYGCRALLSTLHAGEQWIAMHIGLAANGVLQYWLPVYHPDYGRYAPGRLLIHHVLAACRHEQLGVIDRGEGDTSSKRELANEEHYFYRGAWRNRSAAGQLARGVQSIKWRLGA